ncbi:MAG: glycosyltransferase family 2 protein [Saccharospirillum sp.]|uniref:glycosyltransferase family 2 protein n=1 Tax=Saccharospirillum sp. TaxID=2033801 RepID=UPI00329962B0
MKQKGKTVSAVIPTLNRSNYLREAVSSVLNQSYPVLEVIVIDDGSSEDIKQALADIDGPIKIVRHDKNMGHSAARNTGIRVAKGDYIAFLDSDDLWLPKKIETQIPWFDYSDNVGLVGGGYEYVKASGEVADRPKLPPEFPRYEDLAIGLFAFSGSSPIAICKKEVFKKVGFFDDQLILLEDWDMWIRISEHFKVINPQKRLVQVRMHDEVRTHRPPWRQMVKLTEQTRATLNARIKDKKLRKKAKAASLFNCYVFSRRAGSYLLAAKYLVLSFYEWPLRIHPRSPRLRQIIGELIGRW